MTNLGSLACLTAFCLFQILKIGYSRIFKKDYQLVYLEKKEGKR